ncbi:MAG: CBS domain-containing protein [Nitrospira sp.]|nr:CBS domain-containing protein [Nitrospira sp.]
MTRDCPTVSGRMSLAELVQEHILKSGRRCFVVAEGSRLDGLVTLHQIKAVPQARWTNVSVGEAMTPLATLRVVAPETPILEVLQTMEREDVNQVPVAKGGRLIGHAYSRSYFTDPFRQDGVGHRSRACVPLRQESRWRGQLVRFLLGGVSAPQ